MTEARSAALDHYHHCMLCEHRCGVNRFHERGRCRASATARLFRDRVECGEESFLNPCHLFYLSGCDLRCVYCINELNAFDPSRGRELTPDLFRQALRAGQARGARTLQWVGGEPTIHLPGILAAMEGITDLPPVVWKSDFHFTPEALDLLTGVVDVFIADFKFGNDACAQRLASVSNYLRIVTRNLRAAQSRGRLIVRHLLLPGHHDCCWKPIATWLAENMPEVEVSLRGGFLPRWRAKEFTELARPLEKAAFPHANDLAHAFHLKVIQ